MRSTLALFVLLLAAPTVAAERAPRVTVYCYTAQPQGGFTDAETQLRQKSAGWLRDELARKKKELLLVAQEDDAQVTIEVTAYEEGVDTGTVTTDSVRVPGTGLVLSDSQHEKGDRMQATLRVGTYSKTFDVTSTDLSGAAPQLARELLEWVRMNRERLTAK